MMKPNILLVDDDQAILFGLSRYLKKAGYNVGEASRLGEAKEAIASRRFHAVILDMILPDGNGIDWIAELRRNYPEIAVIVVTGAGDIPMAVDAMRLGADNFLTKPVSMPDLHVFLRKCLEIGALRRKDLTQQRLTEKFQPCFGKSPAMEKVMELVSVAAENDSTVLLLGETGTGKGILARWIYENGSRKSGPFIEINCSGLSGELLANELFGHVKGAFTSASEDMEGLVELADGGTLFLDEIGDMDFSVQSKFLKVVEEKHYRRLGDAALRRSDFRLISATNKDLQEETVKGRFRSDLFFRINVFPIGIPPLRERLEDLPDLVSHFLTAFRSAHSEISPEAMSLLMNYPWPGNIRELRNVLERALLLAKGNPLSPLHFPGLGASAERGRAVQEGPAGLERLEEKYIKTVVETWGGDVAKAAESMGMSRATLYRKLKKFQKPL